MTDAELTAGIIALESYVKGIDPLEAIFAPTSIYQTAVMDIVTAADGSADQTPAGRQAAAQVAMRAAIDSAGDGSEISDQQIHDGTAVVLAAVNKLRSLNSMSADLPNKPGPPIFVPPSPGPAPLPTPDPTTLIPTAKGLIDRMWTLDADKSMVDQFGNGDRERGYMTWVDFTLLAMMGNYFSQWLYGGDDAPSPLTGEADTFDDDAWKKSHPANHLDDDPVAKDDPGFVEKMKMKMGRP